MRMHAGIASACAGSARSREGTLDAGTWFAASSAFGVLRLCAFAGAAVPCHAADAALALHRCEALLDALEAWMGQGLAWRWADASALRPSAATHACARWQAGQGGTEPECLLALPWALLRRLPPPSFSNQLEWPAVPVMLAVSQCRIGLDELALLEPGGAVVLPESLQRPWHGLLRAADEAAEAGLGVRVALDMAAMPRLAGSAPGPHGALPEGRDERVLCEVRLATPRPLPSDRLTGWVDGEAIGEVGPHAGLWRCADEAGPAQCLASGSLMPWGDGWALQIETVCTPL